jgi:hypothetical protein
VTTALGIAALLVGLALLWSGRQRFDLTSRLAAVLSCFELLSLALAAVALGWIGILIVAAVTVVGLFIYAVKLAIQKDALLTSAVVQSDGLTRDEVDGLWRWTSYQEELVTLGPLGRARLIQLLAIQARTPAEIRAMAVPIGSLSIIFDEEPGALVPRFDQLLRLYGKAAADARQVADALVRGTQHSASTFDEMVAAMIVAGGGEQAEELVA